jgi:hypothetical protein
MHGIASVSSKTLIWCIGNFGLEDKKGQPTITVECPAFMFFEILLNIMVMVLWLMLMLTSSQHGKGNEEMIDRDK